MTSAFVHSIDQNQVGTFLGNWEETDPCRYKNQSCKGKLFGALKDCRARRSKSRSLCEQKEALKEKEEKLRSELPELQEQALRALDVKKKKQQNIAIGFGSILIVGSLLFVTLKKK